MAWLLMDMSVPRRSDFYAAQTAYEIRASNSSDPKKVDPKTFLLKFKEADPNQKVEESGSEEVEEVNEDGTKRPKKLKTRYRERKREPYKLSKQAVTQAAMAQWVGLMTVPVEVREGYNGSD